MNTLDSWLGARVKVQETSPIKAPPPRKILGILGSQNREDFKTFQTEVMESCIKAIGGLPELVLLNDDNTSSGMVYMWCEKNDIPCQFVKAEWQRDGKKARVIRDNKIIKDSTAFIALLGPRSDYYRRLSQRLEKKNIHVTLVECPKKPDTNLRT